MPFEGFTEEDIIKLKSNKVKLEKGQFGTVHKSANFKKNKKALITTISPLSNDANHVQNYIPSAAKLTAPQPSNDSEEKPKANKAKPNIDNGAITRELNHSQTSLVPPINKIDSKESTKVDKVNASEVTPNSTILTDGTIRHEKKIIDLDEFQARQKLIEEQNRKRKELLAKALADRAKQTQEEAQRLNEIQEEFKKLDALLATDVQILRKKIDIASADYLEAQKKYNKVEKEFLEAKLALHQKLERKEMLTEHLCTIIEKNEERKADKLTELLNKLNLESSFEETTNNNVTNSSNINSSNSI